MVECVTFVNVPLAFVKEKLTKTDGENTNPEEEKKQQSNTGNDNSGT